MTVRNVLGALVLLAVMFFGTMSSAFAYVVFGPTMTGIWGINPVTGQTKKYATFSPAFTSTIAAMAQRPSDGVIFFIVGNAGNDPVYTWDPSNPSVAPTQIGTTGTGIPYSPRLGFDPNSGILYAMDTNAGPKIYTVNQTTGAFTATGATVSNLPSGGGDLAIDTDGTMYVAVATTLYKTTIAGGTATTIGTISAPGGASVTGLAVGVGNNLIASSSNTPSDILTISKTTAATTATSYTISDGTNQVGDLAGIFEPDLQLTKTDNGPFNMGQAGTYTLTVTNIGNVATNGSTMTLTDTIPSNLTINSVTPASGWSCGTSGQTVTCTSSSVMAPNASAATTISVTPDGTQGTVTNNATVTGGGVKSFLSYDGKASDTTTINRPDLTLTKTDNGPWTAGGTGTYTIVVKNSGGMSTSGTMTLTDTMPTGITVNSVGAASGWTCTTAQTVSCTSNGGTTLAAGATATFTINITVAGAGSSVTNNATVTGGNVPASLANDGKGSDTTSVTINSSGAVFIGPYDSTDANFGSQYTGSFDGVAPAGNNYDFTAASIPFPGGTWLGNNSTTPGSPNGATITAASVTMKVKNSLYYNNTANGTRTVSLSVTAPSGWTAQICPDNGSGTPVCSGATAGACTSSTWLGSAAGATATASCTQNKRSTGITWFWVVYTTPASGLTALTRYDAVITATENNGNTTNDTHNELYSGFVAVTKTATVTSTGCPAGMTPTYASGVCPGGTIKYTLDYRNIVAGGGLGTEGAVAALFPITGAGTLTLSEDGNPETYVPGSNWATYAASISAPSDTTPSTVYTYTPGGTVFTASGASMTTKFQAQIGGSTFRLYPSGFSGQTSQGSITFNVVVK